MEFALLGTRPEFIPVVSRWYFDQWGAKIAGMTLEKTVVRVSSMLHCTKIPLHLLAVQGDQVLGVAQLKYREMDIYPEKEHWLGGVYVVAAARGRGVGAKLIEKAVSLAKELGVVTLHLQTEHLDGGLYKRLGWQPIEQRHYNGFDVLVMQRTV